ncbi:FmdB family zinc ribbon protein [Stackebrandtia soli]|uniref:FmdB family zinc ribbon protein n=1 Tax=Stackebrandtia soli TaxID=1892856 RepID=UPI0039EB9ECF
MPTYQYRCTACGSDLEAHQSFSDDPLTDCTACGEAGVLRKQFGSVGVVFKGSGFYRNDARRESSSTASKDTSTKKPAEKKTESTSKSETKSETKKSDSPKKAASTTSA